MYELSFGELLTETDYPPYALIVLNMPIDAPHIDCLIERASFIVCADGGFDRLMHYYESKGIEARYPDTIVGDLDSIRADSINRAREKGIQVIRNQDDSKNDFQKSLETIRKEVFGDFAINVVVVGALDGRFDHTCASISVLYENKLDRIWLVSEKSVVTLLRPVTLMLSIVYKE